MNAIEIKNEYNEKNRRADKFNQHISYYNCKRKSINIGSKFFFGIEVEISYSKILYLL